MFIKKLFIPVLIGISLLVSCSSEEEEVEVDPYEGRHADFYPREDFYIKDKFKYFETNTNGYEGVVRKSQEIEDHRPLIEVIDEGAKLILTFHDHPHMPNHYWAWIEVIDKNGTEFYEELGEPTKDIEDFKFEVIPEKPFRHRVRIRAFCHVHGEFLDYIDLPDFEKKSIID